MDQTDIIVIGAGIAGLSLAAELSGAGADVLLLERESQPGYHSTGRSAAILAQTYGTSAIWALTSASEGFFLDTHPEADGVPLLTDRGLMRIARKDQLGRLRDLFETVEATGFVRWVDADEACDRMPLLRKDRIAAAFVNYAARDIEVSTLQQIYTRRIRAAGNAIQTGASVRALRRQDGHWHVTTGQGTFSAPILVNAAGAWAGDIADLAGASAITLTPTRRSAITFAAPEGIVPGDLPMTVDADEEFYLKPEAGMLMASPGDETPCRPSDVQPEELDIAICVDRITGAFDLTIPRIAASWAGLRTFSEDRVPICGFDPVARGFFWLAGQGGSGVQTAPGLSRLACCQIMGHEIDDALRAAGLDPADLAPDRFDKALQRGKTYQQGGRP